MDHVGNLVTVCIFALVVCSKHPGVFYPLLAALFLLFCGSVGVVIAEEDRIHKDYRVFLVTVKCQIERAKRVAATVADTAQYIHTAPMSPICI